MSGKPFVWHVLAIISHEQYVDLRRTFYGGASALYFMLMKMLEPGEEPTEADPGKDACLSSGTDRL